MGRVSSVIHSGAQRRSQLFPRRKGDALLIFESPEAFAARNADENDPYLGAWRAYYKALVEANIYVGGNPLQPPETGTTVRLKDGKRRVQDGPFADTKEQLGGFTILELPSLDAALECTAQWSRLEAGRSDNLGTTPR